MGIGARLTQSTPYAVVDIETTGLSPGPDRIVEIAVVRVEPDGRPEVVLDTLVNPRRRMAATEIHGITDADVCDAPPFQCIAGDVVAAFAGAVVVAHNVYFDTRFLRCELEGCGLVGEYPCLCTMHLSRMLGLGRGGRLEEACARHGIELEHHHTAAADALAAARLLQRYLELMPSKRINTFSDLALCGDYKFCDTWRLDLPAAAENRLCLQRSRWKSRYFSSRAAERLA